MGPGADAFESISVGGHFLASPFLNYNLIYHIPSPSSNNPTQQQNHNKNPHKTRPTMKLQLKRPGCCRTTWASKLFFYLLILIF